MFGTGVVKRMLHALGDVTAFTFISEKKEIAIEIVLKGESEPTTLRLCHYRLTEEDGILKVRFDKIVSSKEWMTAAGEQYFNGRNLDVPKEYTLEVRALFGEPRKR